LRLGIELEDPACVSNLTSAHFEEVQQLQRSLMQAVLSPHAHISQEHCSIPRSWRNDILSNLCTTFASAESPGCGVSLSSSTSDPTPGSITLGPVPIIGTKIFSCSRYLMEHRSTGCHHPPEEERHGPGPGDFFHETPPTDISSLTDSPDPILVALTTDPSFSRSTDAQTICSTVFPPIPTSRTGPKVTLLLRM
jgi:hypothetical protein